MSTVRSIDDHISKKLVIEKHRDLPEIEKVVENLPDEINIFDYVLFGHQLSGALSQNRRFDDYRNFVSEYNKALNDHFYLFMKEFDNLYGYLATKLGAFIGLKKPDFAIKDITNIFEQNSFMSEQDLEHSMFDFLKDWRQDWIVQRQQFINERRCDINVISYEAKLAIELKKDIATRSDVYQTFDYTNNNSGYEAILIAKHFSEDIINLAESLNISCFEYQLGRPIDGQVFRGIYFEKVSNNPKVNALENDFEEINFCDGIDILFKNAMNEDESFKHYLKMKNKFKQDIEQALQQIQKEIDDEQSNNSSECPRCQNEQIEHWHNYCGICGLPLKGGEQHALDRHQRT